MGGDKGVGFSGYNLVLILINNHFLCQMNFSEAKKILFSTCEAIYSEGELNEMLKRIFEHHTQKTMLEIKFDAQIVIDDDIITKTIQDLLKHKPIQYSLGYEWFGSLKLKVNEHVLIPRPETEELVHWIKEDIKHEKKSVLDIGTGSGCIPIWLKTMCPQLSMTAIDISKEALAVAIENADRYDVGIEFKQLDILANNVRLQTTFDIIISNPPYITLDEKESMESNVLDFEPDLALFVSNQDALQFYKAIKHFSDTHLNENGIMYFEVGKQHAYVVKEYFEKENFQTKLRKDMYGNERMLKVWR